MSAADDILSTLEELRDLVNTTEPLTDEQVAYIKKLGDKL